jgi:hypothetical protein
MTRPSERENSAVRQPPVRAHVGDSSSACGPTCCSSSDSVPSLPGSLESEEPRCTSQTVAKTYRENCRYSDCQFSMTSTPKDDEVTWSRKDTVGRPFATCRALWSAVPAIAWPTRVTRKSPPNTRLSALARRKP